jgi:transglutaminase/protease-like cytokinesis protein 3
MKLQVVVTVDNKKIKKKGMKQYRIVLAANTWMVDNTKYELIKST